MSANKNKFLMVTPSESRYLDVIREFVAKVATIAGFDDEHVNKIQLSVDEACTNVVKHAYRGMDSQDIKVQIEFNPEQVKEYRLKGRRQALNKYPSCFLKTVNVITGAITMIAQFFHQSIIIIALTKTKYR